MKTQYNQVLKLPKSTLEKWDNLLSSEDLDYEDLKWGEYETVAKWTIKFPDGCEIDLKVNTNAIEDKDLFCEMVLFDSNGCQLDCSEVEYELSGEWNMASRFADYHIDVIGE